MEKRHHFLLALFSFLQIFSYTESQSFIGVNYGQQADNLPPPDATARLLESTTISKLRLYGSDPSIIQSLANTTISLTIGTSNADIPTLASSPSAATQWISINLLPFIPATTISIIAVGNEVLGSGDPTLTAQLLPAMQNLQTAIATSAPSVKISTVHSMAILSQSDPPSSGSFHPDLAVSVAGILAFLEQTASPFMINPYPYFAYGSDPRPETLAFCLFEPNPGRFDPGSGVTYTNMFDAQVDAIGSALKGAGFGSVEIVVAETGWPDRGDPDEVGATVENARAFIGGLVGHLRSMVGTPMMPGKSVDTYIFALYDEDLKPGPTSEKSFGLFRPDLSMAYDAGLLKTSLSPTQASTASSSPATLNPPGGCIRKGACGQPSLESCTPILPGGDCYLPNSVGSHTSAFAMNLLRQIAVKPEVHIDVWHNMLSFSFIFLLYAALPLLALT